jgi:hypothetical protein
MLTSTSSGTPQPTQPISLQARLAVITALARLVRNDGVQTAVQQAQSADLQVQDGIELITLDGQVPQSHAILYFPDFVNVELFASTNVVLADARQDENGAADVTVDLEAGHMFVHLNEAREARVTVQTPNAAVRSLTSGAQFDVCRTGELTCILVKQGVVEVTVQNRREILRAGSAGIVPNDQPLSPAICAPLPGFLAWEEDYRLLAGTPALHEEIAALPQKSCPVSASGLPWNARILYEDEFSVPGEWTQGESGSFAARYATQLPGAKYYQVDVQGPAGQYLSFVPNGQTYEDVNIDLKTRIETGHRGDFRYGMVFRRSGEQYYAFVVSPTRGMWYVLKSTANGVEVLRSEKSARIRGLEGQDTLRLESYGDTFLLFINDRFIDWVRDAEYASGEVGLFVESIDNQEARINFNAITLWVLPASQRNPAQGENCFNALDDDADGWIDQADPNCQHEDLTVPSPVTASRTPRPTRTPKTVVTRTAPPATNLPPSTPTKRPPATQPPILPTLPPVLPTIPPILPTIPPIIPTILPILPTLPLPLGPPPATAPPG